MASLSKASLSLGSEAVDSCVDVALDLDSLRFENGLTDDESSFSHLRRQNLALTVGACAIGVFVVARLRDLSLISSQLKETSRKGSKGSKGSVDSEPYRVRVGVIGCGRLGTQLVECLLSFGEVRPDDLYISTRRPDALSEFRSRGCHCGHDNGETAKSVDVVFLSCLPSHLNIIADDLKGNLSPHTLVFSFLAAVKPERLRSVLGTPNVICPQLESASPEAVNGCDFWNLTGGAKSLLEIPRVVELTCPLREPTSDSIFETGNQFPLRLMYTFVNFCHFRRMTSRQTVVTLNSLLLGCPSTQVTDDIFVPEDFGALERPENESLGVFDLVDVRLTSGSLQQKLCQNNIRKAFVAEYSSLFSEHLKHSQKSLSVMRRSKCIASD